MNYVNRITDLFRSIGLALGFARTPKIISVPLKAKKAKTSTKKRK